MHTLSCEDVYSGESVLHPGHLVRALKGQRGVGRVERLIGTQAEVAYFGGDALPHREVLESRFLVRVRLIPGTLCLIVSDETAGPSVAWIRQWLNDGYEVALPDGGLRWVAEREVRVYGAQHAASPEALLAQSAHGNPLAVDRRRDLVQAATHWRRAARGLWGLVSARQPMAPHVQALVQAALQAAQMRFILADSPALGRDACAIALLRQLLIENPKARVLIIVQHEKQHAWRAQLHDLTVRSGGNPLQFAAPEELELGEAISAAHILLVDEAESVASGAWLPGPGRRRFDTLRRLAGESRHVLLLAETTLLEQPELHLALLHLLAPGTYPLEQRETWSVAWQRGEPGILRGERLRTEVAGLPRAWRRLGSQPPVFRKTRANFPPRVDDLLERWRSTALEAEQGRDKVLSSLAAAWVALRNARSATPDVLREVVQLRQQNVSGEGAVPKPDWRALCETPHFAGEMDVLSDMEAVLAGSHPENDPLPEIADWILAEAAHRKVVVLTMYPRVAHVLFQRCAAQTNLDGVAACISSTALDDQRAEIQRFQRTDACRILIADESLFTHGARLTTDCVLHVDAPQRFVTWVTRLQQLEWTTDRLPEHLIALQGIGVPDWQSALTQAFWSEDPTWLEAADSWQPLDETRALAALLEGPAAHGTWHLAMHNFQSARAEARQLLDTLDPPVPLGEERVAEHEALQRCDRELHAWQWALEGWLCDVLRVPLGAQAGPLTRPAGMPAALWQKLEHWLAQPGCFARQHAIQAPEEILYRPGAPLVDAVLETLAWNMRGQTGAVWRQVASWPAEPGREWLGLRLDWVVEADTQTWLDTVDVDRACLQHQADALCPPQFVSQWVGLDGTPVTDPALLDILNLPYSEAPFGHQDWPLVRELLPALHQSIPASTLQAIVPQAVQCARDAVPVREFMPQQALSPDAIPHVPRTSHLPAETQASLQNALLEAVRNPRLRLDTITLMVVAGRPPAGASPSRPLEGPRHAHPRRQASPPEAIQPTWRARREARGFTVRELAALASVSTERLNALETRETPLESDAQHRVNATLEALAELAVSAAQGPASATQREQRGQSLVEAARELGITPEALARIEAEGASPELARRLARALYFPTDRLTALAPFLGRRLTSLRKAAALSQVQLAERLEVPSGVVAALELGRVTPSDALLAKLQALLPIPEALQAELMRLRPRALDLGDPDADLEPPVSVTPEEPLPPLTAETAPEAPAVPPGVDTAEPLDLRSLRQRKGLSQKELADMLGVSTAMLSFCERGTKQLPPEKAHTAARIMAALADVTSSEFVGARLREKLERQGWDASQLAQQSGVSLATIQTSLEIGFDNAAREDVRRLFNALGNRRPLWQKTETGWHGPSDADLEALGVPAPLFAALREGNMIPADALYENLVALNASVPPAGSQA